MVRIDGIEWEIRKIYNQWIELFCANLSGIKCSTSCHWLLLPEDVSIFTRGSVVLACAGGEPEAPGTAQLRALLQCNGFEVQSLCGSSTDDVVKMVKKIEPDVSLGSPETCLVHSIRWDVLLLQDPCVFECFSIEVHPSKPFLKQDHLVSQEVKKRWTSMHVSQHFSHSSSPASFFAEECIQVINQNRLNKACFSVFNSQDCLDMFPASFQPLVSLHFTSTGASRLHTSGAGWWVGSVSAHLCLRAASLQCSSDKVKVRVLYFAFFLIFLFYLLMLFSISFSVLFFLTK